jgi:RimJ/RimL family protein N-acetyltransferase
VAVLDPVLCGSQVRLEPLQADHAPGLAAAAAGDPELYRWTRVPTGQTDALRYVETAAAARQAGTAAPFAVIRLADETLIGSTRLWDLHRFDWPASHRRHGSTDPDTCEIGHTWLAHSAIRTGVNTEIKRLMLTFAFETWHVQSVCFHTDARTERSRRALARIGARYEGILRAHRLGADGLPRDSARFAITAADWPAVRAHLAELSRDRVLAG